MNDVHNVIVATMAMATMAMATMAMAMAEMRQDVRFTPANRIPLPPRSKCRYNPSIRNKIKDKRRRP